MNTGLIICPEHPKNGMFFDHKEHRVAWQAMPSVDFFKAPSLSDATDTITVKSFALVFVQMARKDGCNWGVWVNEDAEPLEVLRLIQKAYALLYKTTEAKNVRGL
jgi:hypothetical protein